LTFEGVVDLRPGDSEAGIEAESFATAAGCGMKAAAGFRSPKRLLPPLVSWPDARVLPNPSEATMAERPLLAPFQGAAGIRGFSHLIDPVVLARRGSLHQPAIFSRASGSMNLAS
jgi:hypothetical protein